MKTPWYIIILLGFSLTASLPATSQNTDKKQSKDIDAINQLAVDLDAAWNRHDAVALSELFTDNADFQWHTGDVLKNQKQIEQYFSMSVFKDMPMDRRHNFYHSTHPIPKTRHSNWRRHIGGIPRRSS